MELTFGQGQVFTSERLNKYPILASIFRKTFGYSNVGNYARFTIFKKLVKGIELPETGNFLDLGTGYGEYALSLASALPKAKIHALDIDQSRINAVQSAIESLTVENIKTHRIKIEYTDLEMLDFIFTIDVFEHIAPEEMPFSECYKKLKPGGYFLVKIPSKIQRTIFPERLFEEHHEWLEDEHIGQVYELEGLSQRFKDEGFNVIHASYSDGWLSRLGWETAYLGKKIGILGQLITLPLAKIMIHLDRIIHHNKWGNAIQVIGQKPL
ncbi:SAM-dependent methyltransferase [Roseivirga sp.]|uniref:SAM-dependent methyltransferase n=1 Tax=Roseivirga sp. TaxID=1964215 RepID=UPI003B8D8FEE